jgi:hypothetical protein
MDEPTIPELIEYLQDKHLDMKEESISVLRTAETLERRQYQYDLLVKLTTGQLPLDRIQITLKDGDKDVSFSLNIKDFSTLERDIQTLCCGYRKQAQQAVEDYKQSAKKALGL